MKRVVGVVAGVAVLAMGTAGAEAAAARGVAGPATPGPVPVPGQVARPGGVEWGPCPDETPRGRAGNSRAVSLAALRRPAAQQAVECAQVRVPLDHREPYGQTISLALNRVKGSVSRDHNHLGVLLVNPGGPGASGRALARGVAAALPRPLANRYDVIGFDPRGVGASKPALSCVDPKRYYAAPRPDHVPRGQAAEQRLIDRAKEYASACGNRWSWLLPHMTTENSARDLEAIRVALGEERISYLGYSYGSYLGAVYATLYPDRLKRLVLDSVVDPNGVWYKSNIAQEYAFDRRHRDFLTWVAKHNGAYRLGARPANVRFAWYSMRDRLRQRPADGLVGPSELDDVYTVGGYSDRLWPQLAQAFSDYVRKGQTKALVDAYRQHGDNDASDENGYAVYLAVQCGDASWPRDWGTWHADANRVHNKAPFLAWPNTWYNAPCAFWGHEGGTPVGLSSDRRLPSILMLQSRRDAATPYSGAVRMRRMFPSASLVGEAGGNHGVSLAGNPCADQHLVTYLRDGSVPARKQGDGPDVLCKKVAAPEPVRQNPARLAAPADDVRPGLPGGPIDLFGLTAHLRGH